jgi:SAM-dependent methyltransferase
MTRKAMTPEPRFGEARLFRESAAERALFRALGVVDPGHFLHHRYLRWALDRMPTRPASILDAGCGRGDHTIYLAQRYPAARVLGIDVDPERIARCVRLAERMRLVNLRFELGDLTQLHRNDEFDLVVSIDVLEHIPQQIEAVRQLRNALTPQGWFFFHLPTVRQRPVPFDRWLGSFHEWAAEEHLAEDRTVDEFLDVVRAAGLEITDHRRSFGYYTGEMATSLFNLARAPTLANKVCQALMAPVCRLLARADFLGGQGTRYAVAVTGQRP